MLDKFLLYLTKTGDFSKKVVPFLVEAAGGSKKLAAFIGASAVMLLVYLGINLEPELKVELSKSIMYMALAYLGGQGLADAGKEKAKLEMEKEKEADETEG